MGQVRMVIRVVTIFAIAMAMFPPSMASADTVEIHYVSFVDRHHLMVTEMQPVFREIEKRCRGKIRFTYQGGPETLNIYAQAPAVIKGAADMVFTSPTMMRTQIKGADMLSLGIIPVAEQRQCGLHDYMNALVQEIGLAYIGMYPREMGTAFYILSKRPITRLDDLKGLSARGGDWLDGIGPALGFSTVSLRHYEEYTALERGIIDFSRMTLDSMVEFRIFEIAKYLMEPPWASTPASLFMNLKKWQSLPADIQELIISTWYEFAPLVEANTTKQIDAMKALMLSKGVQITRLEEPDREQFAETVEKAMYAYFADGAPEVGQKIYALSHKN